MRLAPSDRRKQAPGVPAFRDCRYVEASDGGVCRRCDVRKLEQKTPASSRFLRIFGMSLLVVICGLMAVMEWLAYGLSRLFVSVILLSCVCLFALSTIRRRFRRED
jgi:hypothetical protein